MATLSRTFAWKDALWNVKTRYAHRWHRKGLRSFWRWRLQANRKTVFGNGPPLPRDLRQLIREAATRNVTWGEERITNELTLNLGLRVSPRAVGRYLRTGGPVRTADPKQRSLTFIRNHAQVIVACTSSLWSPPHSARCTCS